MLRRLCPLLVAAALLAACDREPELEGNPPLPLPPGVTEAADAGDNGIVDGPAGAAPRKVHDALVKAHGMRVRGVDAADGLRLDARYSPGAAVGTLWLSGRRIDLRRVGPALYLRAPAAYWRETPMAASATRLGSTWVRITKDDGRAGPAILYGADDVVASLLVDPGTKNSWSGRRTVRGTPAAGLDGGGAGEPRLWVSTVGPPYPLLLEGGKERISMEILEFGIPARTSVPAGAIDGDRLPTR